MKTLRNRSSPRNRVAFPALFSEYPDIIVIEQDGAELPVSVDRCSRTPAENNTIDNPNIGTDIPYTAFPSQPLESEKTKVFAHRTGSAKFPYHAARNKLDTKISRPDPIVPDIDYSKHTSASTVPQSDAHFT